MERVNRFSFPKDEKSAKNTRNFGHFSSISSRWLANSLSVIIVILVVMDVGFALAYSSYCYYAARQTLDTKANLISSLVTRLNDDVNVDMTSEIRNVVENFSDSNKIELMALGHKGEVIITSSGFSYLGSEEMPDYNEAITSQSGKGYYTGALKSGERVMAVTVLLPIINSDFNAMRLMISLDNIERQILVLVLIVTAFSVLIFLFVILSSWYFIRSIIVPIREIGSASAQIAAGHLDVRVRKAGEDELGELTDIINHMADELQNSNQVKNDFISSVSHELRTPLTAIKGWGETLLSTPPADTETYGKGIHVMMTETDRLSAMVEELLDFSRMENGRLTLVKTKMDLLAELGDAVLMYQARARKEKKEFVYNEPDMLPFVFGDKSRLRQVFINVIDNALKYTDEGDTIRVAVMEKERSVEITISDTGLGIKEEDLPNVKQKFYKANMTRRGSGIGLAVANEIVSLHDGALDIKSEYGVGTVVTITLPAMERTA